MSKNKNIQEMFKKEFDVEIMKQRILDKERKENMKSKNIFKLVFAPICLVAIISGILLLNSNKELKSNIHEQNIETKDNVELNIYDVNQISQGALKFGDEVRTDSYNEKIPKNIWEKIMGEFKIINGISYEDFTNRIPKNFVQLNFYTISLKGYKDANNDYRTHDYVFEYQTDNSGKVYIALCKDEKPLRDYSVVFKGKKSKIGNTELEISQYNNQYLVTFEFENVNYDIETTNITKQELTDLLTSIIK